MIPGGLPRGCILTVCEMVRVKVQIIDLYSIAESDRAAAGSEEDDHNRLSRNEARHKPIQVPYYLARVLQGNPELREDVSEQQFSL